MENIYFFAKNTSFFCLCAFQDRKKQIMNLPELVSRCGSFLKVFHEDEKLLKIYLLRSRFVQVETTPQEIILEKAEKMIQNSMIIKVPSDHSLIKNAVIRNEALMERQIQSSEHGKNVQSLKIIPQVDLKRISKKYTNTDSKLENPFYILIIFSEKKTQLNKEKSIKSIDKLEKAALKKTILEWNFKSEEGVNSGYQPRGFFKKAKQLPAEPEKKKECLVCMGRETGLVTLSCDHELCDICLREYIRKGLDADIKLLSLGLECPIDRKCGRVIENFLFQIYLGQEEFTFFDEKSIKAMCLSCPYCNRKTTNDEIQNNNIRCNHCNQPICKDCYGIVHKLGERCEQKISLMKILGEGERINVCPVCFIPYLKNDDCERVKCTNCSTTFCFRCSVDQSVIDFHGNHFHRKDCSLYCSIDKISNESEFQPKCKICIKNKLGCKLPIDYQSFCKQILGVTDDEFKNFFRKNLTVGK